MKASSYSLWDKYFNLIATFTEDDPWFVTSEDGKRYAVEFVGVSEV